LYVQIIIVPSRSRASGMVRVYKILHAVLGGFGEGLNWGFGGLAPSPPLYTPLVDGGAKEWSLYSTVRSTDSAKQLIPY